MVLRRRPDGAGRTRCVFLVTSGSGRMVCGAGALAPSACKAFPAPHVGETATKVAGCWRTWAPEEVAGLAADPGPDAAEPVISRWNARVGERHFPLPEVAFLNAMLADPQNHVSTDSEDGPATLPEPKSKSGCDTCTTSSCCVVFDPELTGADVLRLVDGVGLEPSDIAELKPTRKDQAGPDAIHLGDLCAWDLRLRRTAALAGAQGPGGPRRCGFLVDLTHPDLPPASRCGVYATRPLVCRLFPSDLTAFGVMVATPEAICPPQAWSQERADLATLHQLHLISRVERERFRAFLIVWNRVAEALSETPHEGRVAAFMTALIAFERQAVQDLAGALAKAAESPGIREGAGGKS